MRISEILAGSPSVTLKVKFTRLRSIGVTVVTTSAPYKLLLMYWRLSSCSARSSNALSKGRPSLKPTSLRALRRTSLSNSLMPSNSNSAINGRSSTTKTTTSAETSMRTSLNKPKPNNERILAVPTSSVYKSPTRTGKDAKTVPGSTRCRPSTRMSRILKGSMAQAVKAAPKTANRHT